MPPFGRLALHSWTLDTTPLPGVIAAAASAGFEALELRRLDFTRCFALGMDNAQVIATIRAGGLPVAVLGVEYGCLFATGEESRRLLGVFRESCENAVGLGCDMLMTAPGQTTGTVAEAASNLAICGDIAAEYGLRLAVEFNSQHPLINGTAVLREIVHRAGRANCGLLLDAYHLQRAGEGGRSFADVPVEEIFVVQYSDSPAMPEAGVRRPVDRLPPGQGVVAWREVFGLLAEKSYAGTLSYEAPNPVLWARPPEEVAREGVDTTRALLREALAAMA